MGAQDEKDPMTRSAWALVSIRQVEDQCEPQDKEDLRDQCLNVKAWHCGTGGHDDAKGF